MWEQILMVETGTPFQTGYTTSHLQPFVEKRKTAEKMQIKSVSTEVMVIEPSGY